jgi:hypothetical protein
MVGNGDFIDAHAFFGQLGCDLRLKAEAASFDRSRIKFFKSLYSLDFFIFVSSYLQLLV